MIGLMNRLVGQPAVPFGLSDAEGKVRRLEEYRGSWLLMVFHRHLG
jgi:peroxiredoxin